jgi:hypothetical protein
MTDTTAVTSGVVRELRDTDQDKWREFLAQHPDSNLYHTLEWRDFVREVFGHRPIYLLAEKPGALSGVLPMFLVKAPLLGSKLISMPYDIGSGGALALDSETEVALAQAAIARAREEGADYLQLRYASERPALDSLNMEQSGPVILSELELRDEATVWKNVGVDQRQSVNRSQKRGVTIRDVETREDFRDLERVILEVFRDFGTPPYGPRYFDVLWRRMQNTGQLKGVLAHAEKRCVGAQLLFCSGSTMICKFSLCVPEAASLRVNAALYWRAIELAIAAGYHKLSFGTSSLDQTGLIKFKDRWGSQSRPVSIYSLPVRGKVPDIGKYYDSAGLERRIWRKLPLPLTRVGGAVLSRWFC